MTRKVNHRLIIARRLSIATKCRPKPVAESANVCYMILVMLIEIGCFTIGKRARWSDRLDWSSCPAKQMSQGWQFCCHSESIHQRTNYDALNACSTHTCFPCFIKHSPRRVSCVTDMFYNRTMARAVASFINHEKRPLIVGSNCSNETGGSHARWQQPNANPFDRLYVDIVITSF